MNSIFKEYEKYKWIKVIIMLGDVKSKSFDCFWENPIEIWYTYKSENSSTIQMLKPNLNETFKFE
jgi:hypothetical protein